MSEIELRFDEYLPYINSSELKSMAKLWGRRGSERKDECIQIIRQGLGAPDRVRSAIEKLTPFEHTALTLLAWLGGGAPAAALAVGLRASGVPLPKSRGWASNQAAELIEPLIKRGLLLTNDARNPGSYYDMYGNRAMVFSDERLLAHAGPLAPAPLAFAPAPEPAASLYRRPPTVVMEIIGVLQAIEKIGGLQLTKAGAVRAGDTRKLAKALGWKNDAIEVDGLRFPNPAGVLPSALYQAGLLDSDGDRLMLTGSAEQFARRSYAEQITGLLHGFIRTTGWREWSANDWYDDNDTRYSQARLALAVALAALPDARAFLAIDDLDEALFERLGEHFSLSFITRPPYTYNKAADQIKREQAAWRAELRQSWLTRERQWLQAALTSWLYFLGIVELGMAGQQPASFRLTDLGRALLHPQLETMLATPGQGGAGAWLVQPDFEVVVYLDRATAEQIAFLERHAERVQAQQHIARYRLTRESIYQGLESGTSPEDLVERMRAGASAELPQNVFATIREWASQRERITLRRAASLLEFPDAAARQAALEAGLAGTAVAERFVLLADPWRAANPLATRVDYARPPPASLVALEDGRIKQIGQAADLLLQPRLDLWAERIDQGAWKLTEASVAAAIKARMPIDELFELLRARLTRPLPPMLGVALRAWAGDRPRAELAQVTVLRCARPVVFNAISSSPAFKPYLRGTLAPDLLLVDQRYVEMLKEQLAWAGLDLANVLAPTQSS
jgi:hypothetical protein